jgi:hypothetical protein
MKTSLLCLSFITLLISCESAENLVNDPLLPGTYSGIFYRTSPGENCVVLNPVSLELTFTRFEGSGNNTRYPSICKGTYTVKGDKVEFIDECFWTAEFDWSLILSGEYNLSVEGTTLKMTRQYENDMQDMYELELQGTEPVQN